MPCKVIGKSVLGELGFSQNTLVMGEDYWEQYKKVKEHLPYGYWTIMTSMTGTREINLTGGKYFPKIRTFKSDIGHMFFPNTIYRNCLAGKDKYRPGCDFVIFNGDANLVATTFSREAPILAFESSNGYKALGVILRPSLMEYGEYLFSSIKEALGGETENITVTLVTCNHFSYPEGSIPSIIQKLADKYSMNCVIGIDSEKDSECYHRGEKGNHVVALW